MAEYFSFEDVMRELELSEEDLKRMVSEGELRAFRDENKMKFKKEDVESLKKGRITEPTIILPSTPSGGTTEETVLDLDVSDETSALADTSLGEETGEPAAGGDELKFDETEIDISADEPEIGVESDETFIEEEIDTGLTTEPLKLADEKEETEETLEAVAVGEEIAQQEAGKPRRPRRSAAAGMAPTAIPPDVEEEIESKRPHWIWTFVLFVALIPAMLSGVFFYDLMRQEQGNTDQPLDFTISMANWVLEQFWEDEEWTKFHIEEFPEEGNKEPPFDKPIPGYREAGWYVGPSFERPDRLLRVDEPEFPEDEEEEMLEE
ncbi:MAG: helix-turn-helix domain-containing protein [Planctomycetota bacterium]|jgi:hypothetical protein